MFKNNTNKEVDLVLILWWGYFCPLAQHDATGLNCISPHKVSPQLIWESPQSSPVIARVPSLLTCHPLLDPPPPHPTTAESLRPYNLFQCWWFIWITFYHCFSNCSHSSVFQQIQTCGFTRYTIIVLIQVVSVLLYRLFGLFNNHLLLAELYESLILVRGQTRYPSY